VLDSTMQEKFKEVTTMLDLIFAEIEQSENEVTTLDHEITAIGEMPELFVLRIAHKMKRQSTNKVREEFKTKPSKQRLMFLNQVYSDLRDVSTRYGLLIHRAKTGDMGRQEYATEPLWVEQRKKAGNG
jgi:hypothetical protein